MSDSILACCAVLRLLVPSRSDARLHAADVADLLAGDTWLAEVSEQESVERQLGVSGVPFFVIDDAVAVSGAQSPEMFRQAFDQAGEVTVGGTTYGVDGERC